MLKNKKVFVLTFVFLFSFGSFVFAESKEWDFEKAGEYIFNGDKINIAGGKAMPALVFTPAEEVPEDEAKSWGAAAADFDGDGDLDVYVANWGQNKL